MFSILHKHITSRVPLTDEEFKNLCCTIYNQVTLGEFDNKILEAVKTNLNLTM